VWNWDRTGTGLGLNWDTTGMELGWNWGRTGIRVGGTGPGLVQLALCEPS